MIMGALDMAPPGMGRFGFYQGLASLLAGIRIMLVILSSDTVMAKVRH